MGETGVEKREVKTDRKVRRTKDVRGKMTE
jgi:hypothetical protein